MLQWACVCSYLFEFLVAVLWGIYRKELLARTVIMCLAFGGTTKLFHSGCIILHASQQRTKIAVYIHLCQHLSFGVSFNYSHLSRCEVESLCGFDLHIPNDSDSWASFHVFIGICISLRKCLFSFFKRSSLIPKPELHILCSPVHFLLLPLQICYEMSSFSPFWFPDWNQPNGRVRQSTEQALLRGCREFQVCAALPTKPRRRPGEV